MQHDEQSLSDELRWQLRALKRDVTPDARVWSGIEPRLVSPLPQPRPLARQWPALAASMLLAVGVLGWWRASMPSQPSPMISSSSAQSLVQREAESMTRQYEAALREVPSSAAPALLLATYDELDRSAAMIRAALMVDPDSRLLLEQLQRTYARRLALAQRVAYS